VVDFDDVTDKATKLFVECLTVLPNLHTLEIISMWEPETIMCLTTALGEVRPRLQQVRTLILPPMAHWLLRYCPNVEDLTCVAGRPEERFVESLVVGRLHHITKFRVLYPGCGDMWQSMVHLVSPPLT